MRQDLDRLMIERDLDAAVVMGDTLSSPTVYYLTGGVKLERAVIILRPHRRPVLIHGPMERDGAATTGMECMPSTRWSEAAIARERGGNLLDTRVETMRRMLADLGISGRIGFYGHGEIGQAHALLRALADAMPESEIVVEFAHDLITQARITKDDSEVEMMRQVGLLTCQVVESVADLLTSRPVSNGHLLASDGEPMTVGHVKAFVRSELARRGLEEPGEHIFALGADAAVPHNHGNPADVLRLGTAIVFDLFPRPLGGGYYHDVTRTWCLGHAPAEVEQAYSDVMASFDLSVAALRVGRQTGEVQRLVCEYFEQRGHPTVLTDPATQVGYVHSLAHGLGLEVHEAPGFAYRPDNRAQIEAGMVFTIEPGLYYQAQGFGVRIEDTFYCDRQGNFHSLTPVAKDLVLPVRAG